MHSLWLHADEVLVLVLSVRSFVARHHSVQQQLNALGIPFKFIFRFDEPDSEVEKIIRFKPIQNMKSTDRSIASKHAEAWRIGQQSKHNYLLVLEDDFLLRPNFLNKFYALYQRLGELPAGHLVNLGGANSKVPFELYRSKPFFYAFRMETSEGYLCDKIALKKLLKWIDDNLVDRPSDHMIRKASQESGVVHYWPKESLVEQGSLFGLFPSELDRKRSKTVRIWLKTLYEWKKFRRRTVKKFFSYILR